MGVRCLSLSYVAKTSYGLGAPGVCAWALLWPVLKVQAPCFGSRPHLSWLLPFLFTLGFCALVDVVLIFPSIRIPLCLGQLYFLLFAEKLHQEACPGDEPGTGQLHAGLGAVHFQSPDDMSDELSHSVVGDEGLELLVQLTFKLIPRG